MGDILFLAHRTPWPPDRGDRIRSYHLLQALTRLGRVHLVAFADGEGEDPLRDRLGRVALVPRRRSTPVAGLIALARGTPVSVEAYGEPAFARAVADLLAAEPIDTIVAFSGQTARAVPAEFKGRLLLDLVDVDSAKFEAYGQGSGPMAWVHRREGRRLAAYEAAQAKRAHAASFVSEAEAALFRTRSGATNAVVIENGIDLARYDPAAVPPIAHDGPLILFTGQMDYPPNVGAVTRFATDALPLIRTAHPVAAFAIVGRAPTPAVRALAALPGVTVTGEVPDTRTWLARADVVVAPLTIARGVQNKVLEAMAMARAVVASPQAREGIDAVPGRDLIVAEGEALAAAVIDLLADPARCSALGDAGRARMIARYGWEARLAGLPALLGRA
ncbi:TIGR03087 family PEP-CTERM/XrtA system glycosyltransferase [Sphingomonas jatrophae]|uniref:Sugar transferase, PEP-CTERM/EpsH1 system associated n=1 Tax=Sphingomonas jatrophae TaxID=1166337 RepID=A0A1I6JWL7_9SPHN|nr:TIGR03087 family PEP-CTERM/XrtA system glycosyltransferase [Sphingomonas jatrophae]SFR83385.1 sugar transferase, PEP-CTERM/EpsH1 system associated [Sphingomonas jatrophae]